MTKERFTVIFEWPAGECDEQSVKETLMELLSEVLFDSHGRIVSVKKNKDST